jgi:ABC-type lipoprotein export system ATPase subunit
MVTHSVSHADRAHRVVNLFDGHIVTERVEKIFQAIL